MARAPKQVVLVTGLPRTGTTAIGDVLAYAPGTRYLYEPFNRHVGARGIDVDFPVAGSAEFSDDHLADLVRRIRTVDLSLRPGVFPHERGPRRAVKRLTGSRATMSYRLCRIDPRLRTIVWKDPMAFFTAHAVNRLGVPTYVTIRSPWAVAASFKRLGWGFDLASLRARLEEAGTPPALDLPLPTREENPMLNGAVLWCLGHEWLLDRVAENRGLRLIDLDAVVHDPVATYRSLYDELGFVWNDRVRARILRRYGSQSTAKTPRAGITHDRRRDVTAVNTYWRGVLDEKDVEEVNRFALPLWERVRATMATSRSHTRTI